MRKRYLLILGALLGASTLVTGPGSVASAAQLQPVGEHSGTHRDRRGRREQQPRLRHHALPAQGRPGQRSRSASAAHPIRCASRCTREPSAAPTTVGATSAASTSRRTSAAEISAPSPCRSTARTERSRYAAASCRPRRSAPDASSSTRSRSRPAIRIRPHRSRGTGGSSTARSRPRRAAGRCGAVASDGPVATCCSSPTRRRAARSPPTSTSVRTRSRRSTSTPSVSASTTASTTPAGPASLPGRSIRRRRLASSTRARHSDSGIPCRRATDGTRRRTRSGDGSRAATTTSR